MNLEPKRLGIPLHRQPTRGAWLVATCSLAAIVAWFFDPSLAKVIAAVCILLLPMVLLVQRLHHVTFLVLFMAYLSFSKSVLIPFLLRLMDSVIG